MDTHTVGIFEQTGAETQMHTSSLSKQACWSTRLIYAQTFLNFKGALSAYHLALLFQPSSDIQNSNPLLIVSRLSCENWIILFLATKLKIVSNMNGSRVMRCKKAVYLALGKWQGSLGRAGNCACKGVAKQAVVPFPLFAPPLPVPRCSWGPPPPSLGTSRCQPWCQLQIPPNPPPQHGNVDFEAKEHTFKSISSFTFSEGGLYELFQNPRIANGTNVVSGQNSPSFIRSNRKAK